MPTTTWVYIIGALALAGVPPLAGFWSKDEILADASHANLPVYILLAVAAFFTAFYMGRQIFLVFYGGARSDSARHAHESPRLMTIPLVALAVLSIFGGLMNLPFPGLHQLASFMEHSVVHAHAGAFVPSVAVISTVLALVAIFITWVVYGRQPVQAEERDPLTAMGLLFTVLNNKWYVDEIYNAVFVNSFKTLGNVLAMVIDGQFWHDFFHDGLLVAGFKGWSRLLRDPIDLGVVDGSINSLAEGVRGGAQRLRRVQTGYVRNYALAVALGVVGIVAYLVLRRVF